jgi:hypothetical protein
MLKNITGEHDKFRCPLFASGILFQYHPFHLICSPCTSIPDISPVEVPSATNLSLVAWRHPHECCLATIFVHIAAHVNAYSKDPTSGLSGETPKDALADNQNEQA